jgi:hypothetical protein
LDIFVKLELYMALLPQVKKRMTSVIEITLHGGGSLEVPSGHPFQDTEYGSRNCVIAAHI